MLSTFAFLQLTVCSLQCVGCSVRVAVFEVEGVPATERNTRQQSTETHWRRRLCWIKMPVYDYIIVVDSAMRCVLLTVLSCPSSRSSEFPGVWGGGAQFAVKIGLHSWQIQLVGRVCWHSCQEKLPGTVDRHSWQAQVADTVGSQSLLAVCWHFLLAHLAGTFGW